MSADVRIFKLSTGEEIIARAEQDKDKLILKQPMIFQPVPTQVQGTMGMALVPWLISAKSDYVEISLQHIIIEADPKDEIEKNYLSSITGLSL
jgi:hypothetical protein